MAENQCRIIAEIGSTHMGKLEYGLKAIDEAKAAGANAVKFQLFPNSVQYTQSGNVFLPFETFLGLFNHGIHTGIDVSASVFDETNFHQLLALKPKFIKFAYSKNKEHDWIVKTIANGIEAIVSCDIMSVNNLPKEATKLFCVPRYPVYEILDFDTIFPGRGFHGFSDHTLGIHQMIASAYQTEVKTIEKHVTVTAPDVNCPDVNFSISMDQLRQAVKRIREIECSR